MRFLDRKQRIEYPLEIVLAIVLILTPRVFVHFMGAPSAINFAHFPYVFALFLVTVARGIDTRGLFRPLAIFFICVLFSMAVGGANVMNLFLNYMLLTEPIMLMYIMSGVRWSDQEYRGIDQVIYFLLWLHMGIALVQWAFLAGHPDGVQGLFSGQGAGHHVGGAVSLMGAIYLFLFTPPHLMIRKMVLPALLCAEIVMSDSKQVILVFGIGFLLLVLLHWKHYTRLSTTTFLAMFIPPIIGIGFTVAFVDQSHLERLVDNFSAGVDLKLLTLSIVDQQHTGLLQDLFGLGPGHTVSRLAMMFKDYFAFLAGIGVSYHQVTFTILTEHYGHYLSHPITGSSLFSMMYSWAGVWGDLGYVGLAVYIVLWRRVWKRLAQDQLSRFFIINVFLFGLVFTWMEEPAYMGFVAFMVAMQNQIRWRDDPRAAGVVIRNTGPLAIGPMIAPPSAVRR